MLPISGYPAKLTDMLVTASTTLTSTSESGVEQWHRFSWIESIFVPFFQIIIYLHDRHWQMDKALRFIWSFVPIIQQ
jgi:hypothetical protein